MVTNLISNTTFDYLVFLVCGSPHPGYDIKMDAKNAAHKARRHLRELRAKLQPPKRKPKREIHRSPQWQREPAPMKDESFQLAAARAMGQSDPRHIDLLSEPSLPGSAGPRPEAANGRSPQ